MEPTSEFDEVASNLSTLDPVQILKNLKDRADELRLAVSLFAKQALECPPEAFPEAHAKLEEAKLQLNSMTTEVVTKPTDDEKDAKVVAQVFKLYPKMKVTEKSLNSMEEYVRKFERIVDAHSLSINQAKKLLTLLSHDVDRIAQWVARFNDLHP
ncbi:hypothetical protein ROZALSC1DRAFT_26074, partial [Rozella allomycis CSF55]